MVGAVSGDEKVYFALSEWGVSAEHFGHPWRQVGRCVYCSCEPGGPRLYQGTIPDGHPVAPEPPRKPSPADAMRRRWGMD